MSDSTSSEGLQHVWGPRVRRGRKRTPVVPCLHCPVVWWPGRKEPQTCTRSRRPASKETRNA
jgi:hypothetical protein